jgi:hypothetical protein
MTLTSGMDSLVPHLPSLEVSVFHIIFNLNGILIATHFNTARYWRAPPCIVIFEPRLKEFLERCVTQFHVYIWSTTQRHNIYKYLDQIWHQTQIFIDPSKVLDQEFCMQNSHFLLDKPNKPIFHKNLDIIFSTYPYTHVSNTLLVDDTLYKSMFNGKYNAIFWSFFTTFMGKMIIC